MRLLNKLPKWQQSRLWLKGTGCFQTHWNLDPWVYGTFSAWQHIKTCDKILCLWSQGHKALAHTEDNAGQVLHGFIRATWPTRPTLLCITAFLTRRQTPRKTWQEYATCPRAQTNRDNCPQWGFGGHLVLVYPNTHPPPRCIWIT